MAGDSKTRRSSSCPSTVRRSAWSSSPARSVRPALRATSNRAVAYRRATDLSLMSTLLGTRGLRVGWSLQSKSLSLGKPAAGAVWSGRNDAPLPGTTSRRETSIYTIRNDGAARSSADVSVQSHPHLRVAVGDDFANDGNGQTGRFERLGQRCGSVRPHGHQEASGSLRIETDRLTFALHVRRSHEAFEEFEVRPSPAWKELARQFKGARQDGQIQ